MASGSRSQPRLNNRDKLVIQSIFSQEPSCNEEPQNPKFCSLTCRASENNDAVSIEWKQLEKKAVELAEKGNLEEALKLFDQAIVLQPEKAAGYNNRAQLWRLKGNLDKSLEDLEAAITMSGGCGAAACQAFTQRAMIKRLQGDDEGCRADFKLAADLGSPFAKKQLVELNPYAALCNSMLAQMMKKTIQGKPTDSIDTLG